jgi:GNAT superfamily N-acetyltransferase
VELSAAQSFQGRDVPPNVFVEFTPADAWAPRQQAGTLWVAEFDGRPEAFLAATAHGDRLHIDEFAVAQTLQGKGIGRGMLATVIDWARVRGFACITLTTFRSVPFNGPFYASAGFREWTDAPPEIGDILARENARGLNDRCAMCFDL